MASASEDVIELGSSDDEAEPAAKKIKPTPNAMVHIPSKFHDVTIKPAKKNITPVVPKELTGKNVTVTKIRGNMQANPYAMKKPNGKQIPTKQSTTINQVSKKAATVHINPNMVLAKPKMIPNKPNIALHKFNNKIVIKNNLGKNMANVIPNKPNVNQPKGNVNQHKGNVNPLNIMKKINSQQVAINKIPSTAKALKNPIKINSPQTINNLPSSITITRTANMAAGGQKRKAINQMNAMQKKHKISNISKTTTGEVLTVDLDDDDVSSSSTASPQWYLRPEEQTSNISELEEANNKEPEPGKSSDNMIEITIEDSPLKPIKDKRACEVGTELTVTIDDSPVKTALEKNTASGSDGEVKTVTKVPHSKKKLEYPKEPEQFNDILEIEISPVAIEDPLEDKEEITEKTTVDDIEETTPIKIDKGEPKTAKDGNVETVPEADTVKTNTLKIVEVIKLSDDIIEIEESPLKVEGLGTSTPKKNHPQPRLAVPESIKLLQDSEDLSEFHPVYQSFIRLCFQLENSDDMKKIVEKKIKTYYRQVPKEYAESEDFTDMVSSKVLSMKAAPEKMYLYIKDIVDELNLQRKMAKSQILNSINEKKTSEPDKYLYGADSEFDSKRQRQIRKLEKTLKKLHRAIQKLEEQEVDFDDDEDSVYLLTESDEGSSSNKDSDRQLEKDPKVLLQRYKERMVRVHAKFCQLTNTKMPSEPRVQLDARPGQAAGPAKRLEKWINKKVPIGTPLPFPDFHDVLRCVRDANDEDKLGWNEADIMEEARDLFTRCGKKLQRRRQENEWRIAASRLSVDGDPAEKNQELMKKLDDNKKIASKKETEVFNKYADRQNQLKLEAEEIGDKEAEESPPDDDEDEPESHNEISLDNKEKRKERLKRLLNEKSKKTVIEKDLNSDGKSLEGDEKDNKISDEVDSQNNIEGDKKEGAVENTNDDDVVISEETTLLPEDQNVTVNENVKTVESETIVLDPNENDNPSKSPKGQDSLGNEVNNESVKSNKVDIADRVHSISDDSSNKLESDVDELHLLQKLHSENGMNTSTLESSDSETPIASSDTLGSGGDLKKQGVSDDVISIENSSYSESEMHRDSSEFKEAASKHDKVVEEVVDVNTELECSTMGIEKKLVKTNNDEYNESIEDILLASTDDEVEVDKSLKPGVDEDCVNLKDDSISIGDTVVEGVDKAKSPASDSGSAERQDDATSVESVACVGVVEESNMDVDAENTIAEMHATSVSETAVKNVDKSPCLAVDSSSSEKHDDASSQDSISCVSVKDDSSPESNVDTDSKDAQIANAEEHTVSDSDAMVERVDLVPDLSQDSSNEKTNDATSVDVVSDSVKASLTVEPNVDTHSQEAECSSKEVGNTETRTCDPTKDEKSTESEITAQSVKMTELKESLSEKPDVSSVEGSGNTLDSEENAGSPKTIDEPVRSLEPDPAVEHTVADAKDDNSVKVL